MWLTLSQGAKRLITLVDEQSIWPAPDGTDSELVVTTKARLIQEVVLVTPKVARVRYDIQHVEATMTLGVQPPAPWLDARKIEGRHFELMLTERGPMVVPDETLPRLPNRLACWMQTVSEGIRSCWPIPPADCTVGTEWSAAPKIPGGLPPNTRSAKVKLVYRVEDLQGDSAQVSVRFGLKALLKPPRAPKVQRAEGRGELTVVLKKRVGFVLATRRGVMEIIRPSASRNQLVRSKLVVQGR